MLCRKSPYEVGLALLIIVVNTLAISLLFWGTFRRILNDTDETWVSSNSLVAGGNALQAFAVLGTFFLLSKADAGIFQAGLFLGIILSLIFLIYMTQYFNKPGEDIPAQWIIVVVLALDLLGKTFALLLGFGVCEIKDITQMANTIGGKRGCNFW